MLRNERIYWNCGDSPSGGKETDQNFDAELVKTLKGLWLSKDEPTCGFIRSGDKVLISYSGDEVGLSRYTVSLEGRVEGCLGFIQISEAGVVEKKLLNPDLLSTSMISDINPSASPEDRFISVINEIAYGRAESLSA